MIATESDANPPQFAELRADELPFLEKDLIGDIFDSRCAGAIIREAFPAEAAARVITRLESGACRQYRSVSQYVKGYGFGPSVVNADSDLRKYFAEVSSFQSECAALFADGPDFQTRIVEILTQAGAGRNAAVPRGPAGEPYGGMTIRCAVPEGNRLIHVDFGLLDLPQLAALLAQSDRSVLLSYFVTLATPQSGGELHVYSLRNGEGFGKEFALLDPESEEARRAIAPYGRLVLRPGPGDLVLLNAGSHYHNIEPALGARARWTIGGFLLRSSDHRSLFYWC